jgi:transcription elongation factor GreA
MTAAALRRLRRWLGAIEQPTARGAAGAEAEREVDEILEARRIRVLRDALEAAVVVVPDGSVIVGLDVVVRDDGQLAMYSIVPPGGGAGIASELSADSPLGRALMGHRPGERAVVIAPNGERVVEIVDVR